MAYDATQIKIAGTGKVLVAPVGTTAPTDVATAWSGTWVDLGATSEDGVTFSDSKDTEQKKIWQAFYAVRTYITGREAQLSFVLEQWNKTTVVLAFGGGTITTTAGPPAHYHYAPPSPGTVDERALGIEWVDGSEINRLIVPKGMVVDAVETNLNKADSAQLPVTFNVLGTDGSAPWYLRTNNAAFA